MGWYTRSVLRIAMICLLVNPAFADDAVRRIEVEVDKTVEIEVGGLIGFHCDQPKLIDAQMKTKKDARGEINVFVVKGVTAGTTQCRIGGAALGASQLFDVVVREQKRR